MDEQMLNEFASNLWDDYKPYLDKIFKRENMSREELSSANLVMYYGLNKHSQRIGTQMYKTIYWYLALHCSDIAHEANDNHRDNILAFYWKEWHNFRWSSKRLNVACSYLGFAWLDIHHKYIRLKVYDIEQLPLVLWKRLVYNLLPRSLTNLLIEEIRRERLGGAMNRQVISDIINTYTKLGLEEVEGKVHKKTNMHFYYTEFLLPFLRDTRVFYEEEKAMFLKENDLAKYEEKMVKREIEEKERAEKILPKESVKKVLGILKRVKDQQ